MAYRGIQVGTGGWGGEWCREFLPPNIEEGLIEIVAAVDVNEAALRNAVQHLGLRPDQCYTNPRKAFDENKADFCTVVVPPDRHEGIVSLALDHGLDILSEKPIADTLEGAARIAERVQAADRKMGVTMSHRFDQDKTTLRHALRSGRYGPLDYLVMRFTCDCRAFGSWGDFRHTMADALLVEGAVHHLDILADLSGAPCEVLYGQSWNPVWGEFQGDSQALVLMRFGNGTRAVYEGAKTNAVGLNPWAHEYIRAECEQATLILNRRRLECFPHQAGRSWTQGIENQGEELALIEQPKWSNTWLIEKFVHWLDGGEPMETNVRDNLQSMALVFAAIESSRTAQPVAVQDLLDKAKTQSKKKEGPK